MDLASKSRLCRVRMSSCMRLSGAGNWVGERAMSSVFYSVLRERSLQVRIWNIIRTTSRPASGQGRKERGREEMERNVNTVPIKDGRWRIERAFCRCCASNLGMAVEQASSRREGGVKEA